MVSLVELYCITRCVLFHFSVSVETVEVKDCMAIIHETASST